MKHKKWMWIAAIMVLLITLYRIDQPAVVIKPVVSLAPSTMPSTMPLPELTEVQPQPEPFHESENIEGYEPESPRMLVVDGLKFELLGTMMAGEQSSAILRQLPEGDQQLFFIGDSLGSAVVLKEIEIRAIVIERAGKKERITLNWGLDSPIANVLPSKTMVKTLPEPKLEKQIEVTSGLEAILANYIPHHDGMTLTPFTNKKGMPRGYYVEDVFSPDLLSTLGLQYGDVISRINGNHLGSSDAVRKALYDMKRSKKIMIKIKRNNKNKKLVFKVE